MEKLKGSQVQKQLNHFYQVGWVHQAVIGHYDSNEFCKREWQD